MDDSETLSDVKVNPEESSPKAAPTQDVKKPRPDLITAIVVMSVSTLEEDPDAKDIDVLYLFVKETLRHPLVKPSKGDIVPTIFAYYLDAYRAYHIYKHPEDGDKLTVYNDAALSVFDLYLDNPQDGTIRQILPMAAQALHEVLSVYQRSIEDRPMEEVISDLCNIALLSQTVKDFVKGSRRKRNYGYIKWLQSFFEYALHHPEKPMREDDPNITHVIPQVSKRHSIIKIIKTSTID